MLAIKKFAFVLIILVVHMSQNGNIKFGNTRILDVESVAVAASTDERDRDCCEDPVFEPMLPKGTLVPPSGPSCRCN